jgi:hypothetical protein
MKLTQYVSHIQCGVWVSCQNIDSLVNFLVSICVDLAQIVRAGINIDKNICIPATIIGQHWHNDADLTGSYNGRNYCIYKSLGGIGARMLTLHYTGYVIRLNI